MENENNETKQDDVQDISMIEQAKKAKEENQKVLEQMTAERKKMEKLQTEMILGGGSRQTIPQKQQTAEEKYVEETKKAFKGLGFSPIVE